MYNITKQTLFFACMLLCCCQQPSNKITISDEDIIEEPTVKSLEINSIEENAVLKFSDVYDSIKFIKLETLDNSLIGHVDKVIATDDKFIILDVSRSKMIFVFDKNGKFLNRIGKNGAGPEEYDFPDDIAYNKHNNELLVWVRNLKKIMQFNLDGTFIKEVKIDWWISSIFVMAENKYLLYLNNISQKDKVPNTYNIIVINNDGKILNSMLPYNKNTGKLSPPGKNVFSCFSDQILFSPYYDNKIYKIDSDQINTKYYLDFDKYKIPQTFFYNVTDRELTKMIDKDGEYAYRISSTETSSHIISQLVYKRKVFDCYYSKESGISKISAMYVNDMYALASSGYIMCTKGDLTISVVESESFLSMQKVVQEIKDGKRDIKKAMLSTLSSPLMSVLNKQLKKNYISAIESSKILLSEEEVDYILNFDESDNPVIRVSKLKKF